MKRPANASQPRWCTKPPVANRGLLLSGIRLIYRVSREPTSGLEPLTPACLVACRIGSGQSREAFLLVSRLQPGMCQELFSCVHGVFTFCSCYDCRMRGMIRVDTEGLRRLRRERALSQRALARAAGVGLDAVNRIEKGRRDALPSTLRKLAGALGVEPRELMKGEE
jgi:DNA-binding XRE family transcriptional regulator